ncbi:UbiA prenyltransferase family [Desarmillaria tabescens]|uniref:UbiA prenyltransferase family n=1 Tax=Armillaria tabescens TaxID=1929756 RepID=A0AA39N7N9_ARMTA|nr:UbiA prenyltransferase family [Desarmillaria tabescens]KAK0460551.1 UbiA prenyltransferase family [Desarmillaria tabescens]
MMSTIKYQLETLYLFTRSDYKTIFFPVLIYSLAVSDKFTFRSFIWTVIWLWLHLLQANVSNQMFSGHEDKLNKPWRPLPSRRITPRQARIFWWCLTILCFTVSALCGRVILFSSAALTLVEILHDDIGLSGNLVLKNLCNVGGYITFELGASACFNSRHNLDRNSLTALICSGVLIFTTISAQDFADVKGDTLSGRRTFPIVAPEGSRYYILAIIPLWSGSLVNLWNLGPASGSLFVAFGAYVGFRFFRFRDERSDRYNYVWYNIWLVIAHALPYNTRTHFLLW